MTTPLTYPATDAEMAAYFKVTPRQWRDQIKRLVRTNPGVDLCSYLGRERRYSQRQHEKIWEVTSCRSSSSSADHTGTYAAPSEASLSARLRNALGGKTRMKSASKENPKSSNVVCMAQAHRQPSSRQQ